MHNETERYRDTTHGLEYIEAIFDTVRVTIAT